MQKPTVKCALLAAMVAKHAWGSPISEDDLLSVAAVESHELRRATRALEQLRDEAFVQRCGGSRVRLDNESFDELADVL